MRHYKQLINFRALFYWLIDITCASSNPSIRVDIRPPDSSVEKKQSR